MSDNKSELLQQLRLEKNDDEPETGGQLWKLILALGVGCLMGAVVVYVALPKYKGSPSESVTTQSPALAASEEKAKTAKQEKTASTDQKILDASGYITARQTATVSAEVMGLILGVDVEEGMKVEKGQVLARIDSTKANIALDLARAQQKTQSARIDSLKAELSEAQRELKRLTNLESAGNFSSESQLSRAMATVERLQADMASARANLEVAKLEVKRNQRLVEDHTIRAPFSGVVTAKNAQAGEIVAPSAAGGGFTRTGICTIVDMESLEIEVDVNEAYIGRVSENQKVIAVLDAYPDWQIPASVEAVIPTADRAKATVRVRIKIDQLDNRILPDMGVKVSFLKS